MSINPVILYGPSGQPVQSSRKLIHGAGNTPTTESWPTVYEDFKNSVPVHSRHFTVSACRKLFSNLGFIREAVEGKAIASVGNHFMPTYNGSDPNGKIWEKWLRETWCPTAELSGQIDWATGRFLESTNVDHSGDIGVLLTYRGGGETKWPCIQYVAAHRINFRVGLTSGEVTGQECKGANKYKGRSYEDGVIFDTMGIPIAYALIGEKPELDKVVPAESFILLKEPTFLDQARGLPAFFHAILESRSVMTTQDRESFAQVIASSLAITEENETGTDEGPFSKKAENTGDDGLSTQEYLGGLIRYFRSGSGGKINVVQHSRPGQAWESFQNRLIRMACAPVWPDQLCWDFGKLSGPGVRAVQGKARRFVSDRQSLLSSSALKQITFALSVAFETGRLPRPTELDWDKWAFVNPPKISIDDGKDSKADQDAYFAGFKNLTEILSDASKELEPHFRQRAKEIVLKEVIRREESEAAGIEGWEIPPEDMGTKVGSAANTATPPTEVEEETKEETPDEETD